MNPALKNLARYIRDLLSHDEELILFGRDNEELKSSTANYIVVDEEATLSDGYREVFDGVNDIMKYARTIKISATINFYGVDAYENLSSFRLLQKSQNSADLQRTLGLTIFFPTNTTDLKFLGGNQYSNRQQMDLMLQYEESADVATLTIEEAQLDDFLINY